MRALEAETKLETILSILEAPSRALTRATPAQCIPVNFDMRPRDYKRMLAIIRAAGLTLEQFLGEVFTQVDDRLCKMIGTDFPLKLSRSEVDRLRRRSRIAGRLSPFRNGWLFSRN